MNEEKSREELLAELAEMRRCLELLAASEANLKLLQEETLLLEKTIIAVNESENMNAAFFAVLWKICSATDWVYGEVWVSRPDGELLERSPVWYGTAAGLGDFSASSEGLRFPPGEGLPGRAWSSKKHVWIKDVTQDENFQRSRTAKEAGIKTGLAIPILAKDETLAILVFFMFEAREEDEQLVRFMSTIIAHLGSVIRRRKAEEELQRSEEYYRSLIENSLDIISVLDRDGTVLYESPSVKKVLGYVPEEMIGENAFDLVHSEDLPKVKDKFKLVVGNPLVTESTEFRMRHKDGSWRILESVGKSIPGHLMGGVIVNSRDITEYRRAEELFQLERKNIEAQLRQAQKMEAIGHLASGVAHEFNNMMTVIQGNTDLAITQAGEGGPVSHNLKEITRVIAKAGTLTKQLLTLGRSHPMEKAILNVNSNIEDITKVLRHLIGENISLKTDLAADLWNIEADPGQIEQLMINMVVNARDAMPDGGRLFIKTENVSVDETYCRIYKEARPGQFVRITVEDTGKGMDADTLAHIFEPFFTTKAPEKGAGLGLSVVYGIVKGHNGWVNVYSEPGKGSVFKTYLPASSGEAKVEVSKDKVPEISGGKERILLVEDEREVRTIALLMLEGKGYKLLTASNYEEAVTVFQQEKGEIDLLFTDIMLPDRSGLELAKELKLRKPDLMVLLTSGYSSEHLQIQNLLLDDYRLLEKPYTMEQLLHTIREMTNVKKPTA